jgi:hypothetical protein
LGFEAWRSKIQNLRPKVLALEYGVWGLDCRFGLYGLGCRVHASGFEVWGSVCRVWDTRLGD